MIQNNSKELLEFVRRQRTTVTSLESILGKIGSIVYERDSFISEINFREEHEGKYLVHLHTTEALSRAIGSINRQLSKLLIEYANLSLDLEECNAQFLETGKAVAEPQTADA